MVRDAAELKLQVILECRRQSDHLFKARQGEERLVKESPFLWGCKGVGWEWRTHIHDTPSSLKTEPYFLKNSTEIP